MEKEEAGFPVGLSFQEFDLGVDSFDGTVAVGQGQTGDRGLVVLAEAAQERVELGQTGCAGPGDPAVEVVAAAFGHELGELTHERGEGGHLGAGGEEFVQVGPALIRHIRGLGQDRPGSATVGAA